MIINISPEEIKHIIGSYLQVKKISITGVRVLAVDTEGNYPVCLEVETDKEEEFINLAKNGWR